MSAWPTIISERDASFFPTDAMYTKNQWNCESPPFALPIDSWCLALLLFNVCLKWVMPFPDKDAFENLISWRVDISMKRMKNMIPAAIFWCIWEEWNDRCFDGNSTPNSSLKAICLVSLFSLHYHFPVSNVDSFMVFVSSLILI